VREAAPLLAAFIRSTNLLDQLSPAHRLRRRLRSSRLPINRLPRKRAPVAAGPEQIHLDVDSDRISLQLFQWPGGVWTPIHDHTSWGVYVCVAGSLVEDRYVRLDEEMQPGRARLRRDWRAIWRPGQQSRLLPYADGIHRVGNPNHRPALSLHLYGPPQSEIDGRDYDPSVDFVCDRAIDRISRSPAGQAA
jgi:predicted metal-dependent enzyme (double-stranded beta helix superfamily)